LNDLVEITPYELPDLEEMVEISNYDWDNLLGTQKAQEEKDTINSSDKPTGIIEVVCPECKHKFEYKITKISFV
jgi:hypothetical protein